MQTESVASRREDVLELAGLALHGRLGEIEQVAEEPLGEPVAAHHVAGAPLALVGEQDPVALEPDEPAGGERVEVGGAGAGRVLGRRRGRGCRSPGRARPRAR